MADRRLLQIILEESEKSPTGAADGQAVAQRYGDGFHPAFVGLIQEAYIAQRGTVETIRLSDSGRSHHP